MDNQTPKKKMSKEDKIKAFVAFSFVFVILVIILVSMSGGSVQPNNQETQKQSPSTATGVSVGKEGFLKVSGQTEVLVASSKENLDKLVKFSVANDTLGMAKMVQSGEAFFVDVGTKILVISSSVGRREIRILEGKSYGESGWIPFEFVSPTK